MKAAVLVKFGAIENAFEIREIPNPMLKDGQVLIQTEGFGLNYADILAIQGDYKDCPPLPAIIGYDVVGNIIETKGDCGTLKTGDRVTAMSRFGGYAEFAATESSACAIIKKDFEMGKAMALTTQYSTAEYCFNEVQNLHKGDAVLIHAAAGGVGTALVQMALDRGCTIFGTCGSDEKVEYLKSIGVHHPINYRKQDFFEVIKNMIGSKGLDAVFDAVGGKSVKKGFQLLGTGGRVIVFGGASMTDTTIIGKIKTLLGFGFYHPILFLMKSTAIIGVNMLRIGDDRPDVLKRCLNSVISQLDSGILDPKVSKVFNSKELTEALYFLKSRKSIGKISIRWNS
jgi:NADPH2:quinone reductase|tara:strand:- start:35523 stop:36545 length:1023 start_codon:yes stop_codon:yes gene_type:complete